MINKIKAIVILSALLISACVPSNVSLPQFIIEVGNPHDDVLYIGDSLCFSTRGEGGLTSQEQAGVGRDCKAGRKLVEYGNLPAGYRIIFLALVTNDVGRTPIDAFRSNLQQKLLSTQSTVYCVLPTNPIGNEDSTLYKQVMMEECVNTIDPIDYNVQAGFVSDGYHWGRIAHDNFTPAITERINL